LRKKRKDEVERMESFGRGRALRGLCFFLIQNSPNLGELKSCIGGGFDKFFISNLCCYNTLNVKNILIISIHLSFSSKALSQKKLKYSLLVL
jgi:hypothetical protein